MVLRSLNTFVRRGRSAMLHSILWLNACTIRLLILGEYWFLAACFPEDPPKPPEPDKHEWPGF